MRQHQDSVRTQRHMRMVPAQQRVAPLLLLALLSASIIPASETRACAARMHSGDETNIKQPTHYTKDILQTRWEARWRGVPALPIRHKTPLRLRGGNEGEYELQGGFFFGDEVRNGATGPPHSPWTTHSHLEMRAKPDGTVKSDNELRAEEHPGSLFLSLSRSLSLALSLSRSFSSFLSLSPTHLVSRRLPGP